MSLKDSLNSILNNVEGAIAVVVMANDGIPIDEVTGPQSDIDIQLLAVEYATVLKEVRRTVDVIKMGGLEEVSIATSRICAVVRVLNEELFFALILRRDGNLGKGRYMMKLKSFELTQELS